MAANHKSLQSLDMATAPIVSPLESAILDATAAAVLVVGHDNNIIHRNETAACLVPAGADLQTVFAGAEFFGEFENWQALSREAIEQQSRADAACLLQRPNELSKRLVEVCVQPAAMTTTLDRALIVFTIRESVSSTSIDTAEVSQRLASLGKLTARVAHELNSPLDGILRYVNLALRVAGDESGDKLKTYLTESRTGLMRMVPIISDLLAYSRSASSEIKNSNINEIVERAIEAMTVSRITDAITIALDFQETDLCCTHGNRLFQVLCNLIKNAIDAMPTGGRLSVITGKHGSDSIVRISDTGGGLPEPIDQVFEPFYTTKPAGKGTGLGLAICKDFIEGMGGSISGINTKSGAEFTVRLPAE